MKPPEFEAVRLSEIDSDRFGIVIARTTMISSENMEFALDFCNSNHVKMLIARCATTDLPTVQRLEQAGFLLMDTLVYFTFNLSKHSIPELAEGEVMRFYQSGDESHVEMVASESFRGYMGHYHADQRLDKAKCDAGYISWAVRSCVSRDVADEVLIAESDGEIVGFATLKLNSDEESEGVLFGVSPKAQGRGLYRLMMMNAMHWSKQQGRSRMIVSTQVTNIAVQKVWSRLGFEPSHSYYTFHKWFDV